MNKKIDFSLVITAHNEGLVAHKTMRSVFYGLEKVAKAGYEHEIVIHIDNGDEATKNYFEQYAKMKNVKIFHNSFGDTGPSRNFAIKKAEGRYVGILDGDDLISDNYFIDAIRMLEESQDEIVVHPEAILTFGVDQKDNVLTIQKDSSENDILILLGENRWSAVTVAKKETFEKIPYGVLGDGYGHEDYVFNIEVIEKGVSHRIAKGTALFYRRSDKSRLSSGNREHVIIPAMKAFDFNKMEKFVGVMEPSRKEILKAKGYKTYKNIRNNKTLNTFITPVAKLTIKVLNYKPAKKIPDFLISEWKKMNRIDSQLYPFGHILEKVKVYDAENYISVGKTYCDIAQNIHGNVDYIFIVPWVVRGGADKVLFNYIEALKEINPSWRFAVIATLPVKNTWADDLPDYVDFIDFGNKSAGLSPEMQDKLMSLTITQLRCKKIHIINSEYGYEWIRQHLELIRKRYALYVSLFAWEYIRGSKMKAIYSYDDPYLFEIFPAVKKVFTDNMNMVNYTCDHNGFNDEKFRVHYQPVTNMVETDNVKNKSLKSGKLHLLWAGRVVPEKLPEIVAEIGRKVDSTKVSIDVYGEIDRSVPSNIFSGNLAVKYKGAYDGFKNIPTGQYDALIYTSLNDGMPNVILEATAAGLPVIASNDGGVGEFIKNGETGVLIEDYLNPDAYVKAIEEVVEKPEILKKYVENAQKLLKKQHSWESFVANVKRDIG